MATPDYRAKTMFAEATGTTRKVSVPSGTLKGDSVYVAIQVAQKTVPIVAPEGWKEVAGQLDQALEAARHAVFYLANWDEAKHGKEFTFSWGGASKGNRGVIWSMLGSDATNPVAAVSNATLKENTPKSKSAICDALTTMTKENRLVTIVFNNEGATATPAAGWTEQGDQTDGPQICTKTTSVEAGVQAAVTHTLTIASLGVTVQFAVQPPQEAVGVDNATVV